MPTNPAYHTYAHVKVARDYIQGSVHSADWTADETVLRRTLESVSRRMDQYVGGRSWGPRTETHEFDIGLGALRQDALLRDNVSLDLPDYWPSRLTGPGILPLDDWLVSATTVTAYHDTVRSANSVLTEGVTATDDYLLWPYNMSPKFSLKLMENTTESFRGGQKTLALLGVWGWQNVTTAHTTINANITDTTGTTFTVASATLLSVGMTIRIDTEDFYIIGIATVTLTVVRGVNGSTAATHTSGANVAEIEYPADVLETCLQLMSNRWTEREAGGGVVGGGEFAIRRPGAEERSILKRLDWYGAKREQAGVYF